MCLRYHLDMALAAAVQILRHDRRRLSSLGRAWRPSCMPPNRPHMCSATLACHNIGAHAGVLSLSPQRVVGGGTTQIEATGRRSFHPCYLGRQASEGMGCGFITAAVVIWVFVLGPWLRLGDDVVWRPPTKNPPTNWSSTRRPPSLNPPPNVCTRWLPKASRSLTSLRLSLP
jgi:hypothetical protein